MSHASIAKIASYENESEIRDFVRATLCAYADIERMLRESDPTRVVVVKPNWIQESHEYEPDNWVPVITHPVVVRCILEEAAEMMHGRGSLVICDAPHTYANFDAILARGKLNEAIDALQVKWPELSVELIDLRREYWIRKEEVVVERIAKPEDPRGYSRFDLSKDSLFYGHPGEGNYYGADYDTTVVNSHHQGLVQEYLLAGTPVKCDLFINVPKLKTHKKTGITCCLKNLVGINGDKNWLPHHTEGSPDVNGDEYPAQKLSTRIESKLRAVGQKVALSIPGVGTWLYRKARNAGVKMLGDSSNTIRGGNWSGNNTCWRMALDLNRALLYGNPDGTWRENGAKKPYLAIVDGIVGGDGNGPVCPDPVKSGVLLAGDNPAVVDALAARIMGLDSAKLPIVADAFDEHRWPIGEGDIDDIVVAMHGSSTQHKITDIEPVVEGGFKPHFGWPDLPLK